ncbi:PRD domain-containing protein [Lederbergia citrea]|uniref:PRD domain-containing protein n=1 Tax=Lederbergia citrea TaxID=2833581 RepID=UPI001BCA51C8|nr:PRD domain-containing protein [Lederbergia citrea]MBS4178143.1 PRD domain-containing protein [Lederbergia citrea]
MNIAILKERLGILANSSVISTRAAEITLIAFEHLAAELKIDDIEKAEMLFTHLPTALTRITKGEMVEAPFADLLEEVKSSPYFSQALREIEFIQEKLNQPLPQEELDYLLIHYTNIMQMNEGGIEK